MSVISRVVCESLSSDFSNWAGADSARLAVERAGYRQCGACPLAVPCVRRRLNVRSPSDTMSPSYSF
ncbi:MAG: hypothetical protein MI923_14955 [Phycisphaerales bacterium]|nr:hypothetical protein [Phycisphaerales bacterium]